MRASEQTVQFLTDYYAALEVNQDYSRFYADDMSLRFANNPTITGRDQVVAVISGILDRVQSLSHEIVNAWEEEDGVVIAEVIGTSTLYDGTRIPANAIGVFTVVDGRFTEQRIAVDDSAVAAATA